MEDRRLVSGWNCTARSVYDEMRLTKERFDKTDGRQYYHFVQSFDKQDDLSPQEVHAMGLELAQREFPNFEVLVATHVDTGHFHNHLVVNSVSFQDGKKLHQSAADLQAHRIANDEICAAHGLEILPPPQKQVKQKRMGTREYRSAVKGESWKFRLMNTIDQCMKYAATREEFISLMKSEGYEVRWTENRKNITYTTPARMKCGITGSTRRSTRRRPWNMNSESGQRLPMEELKRRNTSPSITPQNCPSREEWENLLMMIQALYRLTAEQSDTLENLNQHTAAHTALLREVSNRREPRVPPRLRWRPWRGMWRKYTRCCDRLGRRKKSIPANGWTGFRTST